MMEPINLCSVAESEPLVFHWPLDPQEKRNNCGNDICELINYASIEYPFMENYFDMNKIKIGLTDKKTYAIVRELADEYNKAIEKMKTSEELSTLLGKRPSDKLTKFIMLHIYNRAVNDPEKLNQYEPFSPEVYGETSFDLIAQMLKRVKLNESDVFIDLGSGVGNVVLQVAAMCNCKFSFGIEKAEWPCKYATSMGAEFKRLMSWFGKTYTKFELYNGDFLDDNDAHVNLKEMINEARLIFVNNYAFGAEVDHQLKLRFSNMTEGAIIVSSKPFCSLNFRINSRNLNDIGAILNLNEFSPLSGHVSWTDKPISYYFHKIDRTLLEKYFERLKNPKIRDENSNDAKRTIITTTTAKRSSSSNDDEFDDTEMDDEDTLQAVTAGGKKSSRKKKLKRESSSNTSSSESKQQAPASSKKRTTVKVGKQSSTSSSSNGGGSKLSPTAASSKPFDQNLINTLNVMHNEAVKASLLVASNLNATENNSVETEYNVKAMTKMMSTNIDCKLLKECSIMDLDEFDLREQLGPEVSNSVDEYFKKCKKTFFNYLLCMKLPPYVELVKQQISNEARVQNDMIKKIDQLEKQIGSLSKSSVCLLKLRVTELGLTDIQTPKDLIDFASTILSNHQELLNKVNSLQQTVDSLQNQNESLPVKIKEEEEVNYMNSFEPITPFKSGELSSSEETLTANEDDDDHFKNRVNGKRIILVNKKPFKDYPTYFNTKNSTEQLKSFKIPKSTSSCKNVVHDENQLSIEFEQQQQHPAANSTNHYHFKKKKFVMDYQNNDSNE